MPFTNNVMIVRHKLLTELVKLWKNDELVDRIDRLPIQLSPRRSKHEDVAVYTKREQYGDISHFRCWA